MKNRFSNFLLHLFVKYVPSANKVAELEAKRLTKFIFENYTGKEQLLILDEMKIYLVELTENQLSDKKNEIMDELKELKTVKTTLKKLKNEQI